LLAEDLGFIAKGGLGTLKKDISEIEKMLKAVKGADKVLRKQTLESLTPRILGPSSPTNPHAGDGHNKG